MQIPWKRYSLRPWIDGTIDVVILKQLLCLLFSHPKLIRGIPNICFFHISVIIAALAWYVQYLQLNWTKIFLYLFLWCLKYAFSFVEQLTAFFVAFSWNVREIRSECYVTVLKHINNSERWDGWSIWDRDHLAYSRASLNLVLALKYFIYCRIYRSFSSRSGF